MRKFLLMLCIAFSLGLQAQTEQKALLESKSYDNWYIGINGGGATKNTHNKWMKNFNGDAGVRVGRWFTPAFGLALESNTYFSNKPWASTGTVVRYINSSLAATINLSNWWLGYHGEPRLFEVIAVPALGWGHVFGNSERVSHHLNDMTGKLALDFAFNVDKKKSLQLYLEPALIYSIYGNVYESQRFGMNINRSMFQVNVGLVYKFKNSNGSHNFRYAEPQVTIDEDEILRLSGLLAELEAENERLRNMPPPPAEEIVVEQKETVPEGVVAFSVASSKIEELQYSQINKVAHYLKEHPDMKVILIGSASTEGNFENNKRLSEARAAAVRDVLVNKFGVATNRVEIVGAGETSVYSDDLEYNRVVVFQFVEQGS